MTLNCLSYKIGGQKCFTEWILNFDSSSEIVYLENLIVLQFSYFLNNYNIDSINQK